MTPTPTRNALAALLLLLCGALAASAEVIPIIITNVVVQKIGPEAEWEPLREGLLYWRPADATTEAGLYYADGETPGGVAVCVGKADYHSLTNTLRANGHAIELNAHYSLRAEGDSCLLRYGTNIVLRVDGNREAGSTNSLIKASILATDNEGITIQANALAPDGATIEVTTDLMAVESWTTATNAVVIDSTDVSTTWRITYLEEPFQFYRVFAGASTPHGTGITAERPFTASQGLAIPEGQPLTLGDTTWTNLPDMSTYASNSAVAAVRADLNSLSWRTTTNETAIDANAAAIAAAQGAVATNAGNIATNAAAIGALQTRLDEYWCKWTSTNSLSLSDTNWIPTNWPARTVYCYVHVAAGDADIALPDWKPADDCTLHLRIYKVGSATASVYTANGNLLFSLTGTSSTVREQEFAWRTGAGWIASPINMSVPYGISNGARVNINNSGLPEDATFAPVIEPPSLLSSPSLQSLRPSLSSSAPLALDADPVALDDLAPEDFIDEDFTDPDAEDDALDDAEDDTLPTLDEEA